MAKFKGNDGRILSGSNVIAEVEEFEFEDSAADITGAALDDSVVQHAAGTRTISGSLKCMWDDTDTNGQESLSVGGSVTLNLRPEGSSTGSTEYQIAAIILSEKVVNSRDEYNRREFTFGGNSRTDTTVS